jgi:hypothetical protein
MALDGVDGLLTLSPAQKTAGFFREEGRFERLHRVNWY